MENNYQIYIKVTQLVGISFLIQAIFLFWMWYISRKNLLVLIFLNHNFYVVKMKPMPSLSTVVFLFTYSLSDPL